MLLATVIAFITVLIVIPVWYNFLLIATMLVAVIFRFTLMVRFKKYGHTNYKTYTQAYVFASLVLGVSWALTTFLNYDVPNDELRNFLVIISMGFVTAAVGTLAVWLPAYYAFSLPQFISLIVCHVLVGNYYITFAMLVFTGFMLVVVRNANLEFTRSRILMTDNIDLIDSMSLEIKNHKKTQLKLELHQNELEDLVEERTKELLLTNRDLQQQIEIRSEIEKNLEDLAYYDVLTGLPNRSLLIERLKQIVALAKRKKTKFALLFIDLDRFKAVNDSLGHAMGDKLLQQASARLKQSLRDSDTVARNGGDEFVVVIEDIQNPREALAVSEKIISVLSRNFIIDSHELHIGASIGVTMYPDDGKEVLELIKTADTAMYSAKKTGSNQFAFYSSEMSFQIKDRLKLENALRTALKKKEFYLVYQPQVDCQTNQTIGFEALLRWKSPKLGIISPVDFIPILEESGLIYEVGDWVIAEVLNFIKAGLSKQRKVSINLSALQCSAYGFSEKIKTFIKQAEVDPKLIEFEITETVLINDIDKAGAFLNELNHLGCSIALDDFGSGYSSFIYLTKLPIDVIKIDRSIITDIDKLKSLQDIVKAIVTMCESLQIKNVFEGVETAEELKTIEALAGRYIQGYFYSKPLELIDLNTWFVEQAKQA